MANPIDGAVGGRVPGPTDDFGKQAQTLSEARRAPLGMLLPEPLELTRYPLFGYSLMENMKDQPEARRRWYVQKLGKYHAQLQESAAANRIPTRLLATVILNELADIDPRDKLQQGLISNLSSGSVGMAQINIRTALDHGLLKGFLVRRHANTAARLLAVPQYSIEAAAREIRHLLDLMESKPSAPWPARFKFAPPKPEDRDPLRYYRPGVITVKGNEDQAEREAFFARMVASAYNGGDNFLNATDPQQTKPNSWIHGANAQTIARDLSEFNLF